MPYRFAISYPATARGKSDSLSSDSKMRRAISSSGSMASSGLFAQLRNWKASSVGTRWPDRSACKIWCASLVLSVSTVLVWRRIGQMTDLAVGLCESESAPHTSSGVIGADGAPALPCRIASRDDGWLRATGGLILAPMGCHPAPRRLGYRMRTPTGLPEGTSSSSRIPLGSAATSANSSSSTSTW
jgi:hypothetical protein